MKSLIIKKNIKQEIEIEQTLNNIQLINDYEKILSEIKELETQLKVKKMNMKDLEEKLLEENI